MMLNWILEAITTAVEAAENRLAIVTIQFSNGNPENYSNNSAKVKYYFS